MPIKVFVAESLKAWKSLFPKANVEEYPGVSILEQRQLGARCSYLAKPEWGTMSPFLLNSFIQCAKEDGLFSDVRIRYIYDNGDVKDFTDNLPELYRRMFKPMEALYDPAFEITVK